MWLQWFSTHYYQKKGHCVGFWQEIPKLGNILKINIHIRLCYRAGNQNQKFCKLIWLNTGIPLIPVLWVLETSVQMSCKIQFSMWKIPGFSVIKIRHSDSVYKHFDFPTAEENIHRFIYFYFFNVHIVTWQCNMQKVIYTVKSLYKW